MNQIVNTIVLLLVYDYIWLWYKRRRPKRRLVPLRGRRIRFCRSLHFICTADCIAIMRSTSAYAQVQGGYGKIRILTGL